MSENGSSETGHLRRLGGADAVFLYAETPSMPMHTMGTMILDTSSMPGGFGFEEVAKTLEDRIHLLPPFRRRVLEVPLGLGHPVMVDDPDFRVGNHLKRLAVPAPGGMRELAEVVGHLAGLPLERTKPLWEMWVIEGLAGERLALVTKLHHCVMDGASGSSQMAVLLDVEPDAAPTPPEEVWDPPPLPSGLTLARISAGSRLVGPRRLASVVFDTTRGLFARIRAEREIEKTGDERPGWTAPRTPFNRALTPHRRVAYGSVALEDLKRVKNAFGVTVNDTVLAACALALRRYLLERDALPAEPLYCSMPVSLKTESEREEFSNKVTATTILLPTQLGDPEAVVEAVHHDTANAKAVLQAVEVDLMPQWLEFAPPLLTALGVRMMSEFDLVEHVPPWCNVLVSNVMGPPVPLYFGGARLEAVYPMGPVGEGMGLNITVLSNMGRLDIGVMACAEAVPDPWEITRAITWAVGELGVAAEKRAEDA